MINEIRKALSVKHHPGMDEHLNLPRLAWQSLPYFLSPSGISRPPLTIYWSVNSVCNLACLMCDVGQANRQSNFYQHLSIDGKRHEITPQVFKSVIDEVAGFKPMISITATEPLLYAPLSDIIHYCRERGLTVAITTNGFLLPQQAERLADAGLTRLNVSLDAAPALHNTIRGRPNSFERAVDGIQKFREHANQRQLNAKILINCTVSNLNYHALVDFYQAVAHLPVDAINITYMSFVTEEMAKIHNQQWGDKYVATPNCINEFTQPGEVDVKALYEQFKQIKMLDSDRQLLVILPEFSFPQLNTFFHQPLEFLYPSRCMVNWFIAEIIASGEVIPYSRCYHIPMGNINNQSFMQIWNGSKARQWRQALRRNKYFPACTRCDQIY